MSKLSKVMNDVELIAPDLFCVNAKDFNWLIKQAEGNERLEEELKNLKSVISDSWGKSLYGEINKLKENEKLLNDHLRKFGRLTALYIKAVEGDRDFTDFYNHMAEIVYPNGRINEFNG